MPNTYFKQTQGYRPSAGPGRAKGSTNVLSRSIREGLLAVWHRCGSVEGMVQWVERDDSNRTAFYGFLTKLLPAELAEAGYGSGITVIVQRSQAPGAIPTTETLEHKPLETDPRPLQAGQAVE